MNYIKDKNFLDQLWYQKTQAQYVRIYLLDFNEHLKEAIEGKINTCNISIDGASRINRTCSLNFSTQINSNLHKNWWGIDSKINVEVGICNIINPNYPEIIWLPLGMYIIDSFSLSENATSYNIALTCKDKMAQLDGTVGGYFGQKTVLDQIEIEEKDKTITKEKVPLKTIITDMIHLFGNEPIQNIIVSDLEAVGLQMVKYTGTNPYYIMQEWEIITQIENGIQKLKYIGELQDQAYTSPQINTNILISDSWYYNDDYLNISHYLNTEENEIAYNKENDIKNAGFTKITKENLDSLIFNNFSQQSALEFNQKLPIFLSRKDGEFKAYAIYKIEPGDIAGYVPMELIYSEDLIAEADTTITQILDKIVSFLGGDYEYFYNIYGRFVFRKKQNFQNFTYNPYSFYLDGEEMVAIKNSKYSCEINDKSLIQNIKFTPSLDNVKNDFIVWGQKGESIPICLRYAIDKKPTSYNPIRFDFEPNQESGVEEETQTPIQMGTEYNGPTPDISITNSEYVKEDYKVVKYTSVGVTKELNLCNWKGLINWSQKKLILKFESTQTTSSFHKKLLALEKVAITFEKEGKYYYANCSNEVTVNNNFSKTVVYTFDFSADPTDIEELKNEFANSKDTWLYTYRIVKNTEVTTTNNSGSTTTSSYKTYKDLGLYTIRPDIRNPKRKCITISPLSGIFNNTSGLLGRDILGLMDNYVGKYITTSYRGNTTSFHRITSFGKTLFGQYRLYFEDPYSYLDNYKIYDLLVSSKGNNSVSAPVIKEEIIPEENKVKITSETKYGEVVDWRELIYQMALDYRAYGQHEDFASKLQEKNPWCKNGKTGYEQYYTDLLGYWPDYYRSYETIEYVEKEKDNSTTTYINNITYADWNLENLKLDNLQYWLEFIGEGTELEKISTKNIGIRANVTKDENLKSLYETPVPPICYISPDIDKEELYYHLSYPKLNIDSTLRNNLSQATYNQAAINTLNTMFFNSIKNKKTLDLTLIPRYDLTPNSLIKVNLIEEGIQGDYIINKISYNLASGSMTISTSEMVKEY